MVRKGLGLVGMDPMAGAGDDDEFRAGEEAADDRQLVGGDVVRIRAVDEGRPAVKPASLGVGEAASPPWHPVGRRD